MSSPSVGSTDIFDDLFDPNAPLTEQEKEELQIRDPKEKKPCPECGKLLTWTADGARPRQHKCVAKPVQVEPAAPVPAEAGGIKVDDVVARYVELRDLVAEKKKAFEDEVASVKDKMAIMEKWLIGKLDANGVESMRTVAGTCFIDWKDSATVADWDSFFDWVLACNAYEFLEHRVSKTAVKQRLDEGETPPPGVNYTKIKGVKVRRS